MIGYKETRTNLGLLMNKSSLIDRIKALGYNVISFQNDFDTWVNENVSPECQKDRLSLFCLDIEHELMNAFLREQELISIREDILNLHHDLATDDAVDKLFEFVEGSFANDDLLSIDAFIKFWVPTSARHRLTVNLLRSTSRARDKLSHWNSLLNHENTLLNAEEQNSAKILRGLI